MFINVQCSEMPPEEKREDGLLAKLKDELTMPILTLALALVTSAWYLFTFQFYSTKYKVMRVSVEDFSFYSFLSTGYTLLYKIVDLAIVVLAIIILYEIQKLSNSKKRKLFLLIYGLIYIGALNFYVQKPLYLSCGHIVYLIIIFLVALNIFHFNKKLHPAIFYLLFIGIIPVFFYFLPVLWAENAANSSLNGAENITLTLKENSSGLSNIPLYNRLHQGGKYFVSRCKDHNCQVHMIREEEVKIVTIPPGPQYQKDCLVDNSFFAFLHGPPLE